MNSNRKASFLRSFGIPLLILLFSVILMFVLYEFQAETAVRNTISELSEELEQVSVNYDNFSIVKENSTKYVDTVYQSYAESIASYLRHSSAYSAGLPLEDLCSKLELRNIVIIDYNGKQIASAFSCPTDFTLDRFNWLKAVSPSEPSTGLPVTLNGVKSYYHSAPIDGERIAVIISDPQAIEDVQEEMLGWKNFLSNAKPGVDGFCIAVDALTFEILWAPDDSMKGENILDHLTGSSVEADYYTIEINGTEYYACPKAKDDLYYGNITFYSLIPKTESVHAVSAIPLSLTLSFAIAAAIIAVNCSSRYGRLPYRSMLKHVFPVSAIFILLLCGFSFYVQTLFSISTALRKCETGISNTTELLYSYQKDLENFSQKNSDYLLEKSEAAAVFLSRFPDTASTEGLKEIAEIFDCEEVRIFDTKGRTVLSSGGKDYFALSDDPQEQSHAFWALLQGVDNLCQPPMLSTNGEYRQYAGHSMRNSEGDVIGFVQLSFIPVQSEAFSGNYSFESALSSYMSGNDGFIFAIDKNDGVFAWHPNERMVGKTAEVYGLKDHEMKDGFTGFISLNGMNYLASCSDFDGKLIYAATSDDNVYSCRPELFIRYAIAITACILAYTFLTCFLIFRSGKEPVSAGSGKNDFRERFRLAAKLPAFSSDKRLSAVCKSLLSVYAILIFALYLFDSFVFGSNSIIHYIFSGRWERGLNIFSFTAAVTMLCSIYVVSIIINRLLGYLASVLNSRGETLCRLISNFIKYMSFFVMIFCGLSFLGVDTTTLLASAGIMSIVIGLGANKLIGDILAGLAIVFDSMFQVGGWIETGQYSGFVREIGIRTTKIQDLSNQYHIINNSEIGGVSNSSVNNYGFIINIWLNSGIPYSKVKQLVEDLAPEIRAGCPAITSGPEVLCISNGDINAPDNWNKSYQICVEASCHDQTAFLQRIISEQSSYGCLGKTTCFNCAPQSAL